MFDLIKCLKAMGYDPETKAIRAATQLLEELQASDCHWFSFDEIEARLQLAGHGWLNEELVEKGWNEHYEKDLTINEDWVRIKNPINRKSEVFVSKEGALQLAMRSDSEPSRVIRDKLVDRYCEKNKAQNIQEFLKDLGFESVALVYDDD